MINIRDTRTGVTALMKESMLKHPSFAEFFVEVRNDKPVKNVPAIKVEKKEDTVTESTPKKSHKWGDK